MRLSRTRCENGEHLLDLKPAIISGISHVGLCRVSNKILYVQTNNESTVYYEESGKEKDRKILPVTTAANMPSATPETDVAMQEAEEQDGEAFLLGDTKKLVVVSQDLYIMKIRVTNILATSSAFWRY